MKLIRFLFIVIVGLLSLSSLSAQADEDAFRMTVDPDSAVIRAVPSLDGDFVASAFRRDVLLAVGRNLDGTWFLVQRPSRMTTLGWISRTVVDYDFMLETLPLMDFTSGAIGDYILTQDTGFSAFTLAEVNLRVQPIDGETIITRAPFGVVLPILERDRQGAWFFVNYLGTNGWVNGINLRGVDVDNFEAIPISSNLPNIPTASTLIIPLTIQLSEIQEFRDYLTAQNSFAGQLADFWNQVLDFEVMPCQPPDFVNNYLYTRDDERAFPELEYLVPRLDTATEFVNDAIDAMYECGVKRTQIVLDAKNAALNAGIIYSATLASIDSIQTRITANR